jgi:hypothetical protein
MYSVSGNSRVFLLLGALWIFTLGSLWASLGRGHDLLNNLPIGHGWIGLPVAYAASLAGALGSWIASAVTEYGQAFSSLLLSFVFLSFGWLVMPFPRFWDPYYLAGQLEHVVLASGHLDPASSYLPLVAYQVWPSYYLLVGAVRLITGLPSVATMRLALPVELMLLPLLASLYLEGFKRDRYDQSGNRWNSVVLVMISLFLPFDYLGPPMLGLLLMVVLVVTLGRLQTSFGDFCGRLILVICFSALIISHGLTSAAVILAAGAVLIWAGGPALAATGLALFVAWQVIIGTFGLVAVNVLASLRNPWVVFRVIFDTFRPVGYGTHADPWVNIVRHSELSMGLTWLLLWIAGAVKFVQSGNWRSLEGRFWVFNALVAVVMASMFGMGRYLARYGIYRTYFATVPLGAVLALRRLNMRKAGSIALVTVLLPVAFVARYGYESLISPSAGFLAGVRWVANVLPGDVHLTEADGGAAFFAGLYVRDVIARNGLTSTVFDLEDAWATGRLRVLPVPEDRMVMLDRQSLLRVASDWPSSQEDVIAGFAQSRSLVYDDGVDYVFDRVTAPVAKNGM